MEATSAHHGRGSGVSERESPQEERTMKLVATVVAALALSAFATPALACGDKPTHAQATKKETVAKKASKTTKPEQRPATAQN